MELIIICIASFFTAVLTFFSGFGLGTVLLPVFAIFFPVEIAVALTGVVHFSNNLFKSVLVGTHADKLILVKFGIPAVVASFAGAWLLGRISALPSLFVYEIGGRSFNVTPVRLTIAILLIFFALTEIIPSSKQTKAWKHNYLIGGALSGFFGGLAGLQGAIRSAFLISSGLRKESYIATGVIIATFVDLTRLPVYFSRFRENLVQEKAILLVSAVVAAITGAFLGSRLLGKITMRFIQVLVGILLIIVSIALGGGFI